jgi:signal transduction histidine kinase/CheY-like chemotaxis protein
VQELIVALVAGMIVLGAVPVISAYLPAYLVFAAPIVVPHVVFGLIYSYPFHELLAALSLTFLVAVPLVARVVSRQFADGLRLRFENMSLIEDLRLQSARADQANRAKSSFLASASHDLRQPVHALGLFVGALRAQTMGAEARRLVDHIAGSIRAMDDLFASLLDISKLDAGVVEARLEARPIEPLLDRLCRDYADQAAAKGIEVRRVGCSAVVVSDPVLLERVLRNLIANAVSYTDAGRILVGCRRRGAAITVEVWDTGRGIAPDKSEQVFQEFYQIDNPERDRAKGLGLGLAIVRRITPLIGGVLTLDSQVGRGSVFRLTLPRGGVRDLPVAGDAPTALGAMRSGLILVIDDEVSIQQAMSALLTGWGHRVFVAGSAQAMQAQLLDCYDRPDLIICDYRLRGGVTGIAAIRQLVEAYNHEIPAMLITGDTAPGRISEAHASGYLLLHKPLSNSRLRAAVGQLMRSP